MEFNATFTNISETSTEWKIAERQLSIKNSKSKSWFIDIKRLFIKYGIGDPYKFLDTMLSKHQCVASG
jgi:hypothetical protein